MDLNKVKGVCLSNLLWEESGGPEQKRPGHPRPPAGGGLRKDSGWELSHLINHTKIIIIILRLNRLPPRSVEFKLFIKEPSGIGSHIK